MKALALVCGFVAIAQIGWADSKIHTNADGCPIKVGSAFTKDRRFKIEQRLRIKYKNVVSKPIQIVEFEVEFQHSLSSETPTRKYMAVLKTPLKPSKSTNTKFSDPGVDEFSVRQVKVLRVFFTDGTRWLDKDQPATKTEKEELEELLKK